MCVGALAVCSLQLLNTAIATELDAELVNGNVFLYGDNIEVGIASNGAFGSEVASPRGEMQGKKLGYISDPSKNNFNNGYHGDFFLPQVPEEGWGIYLDGKAYNNNRNQQWSGINGSIISTNKTNTTATTTWQSKKPLEGDGGKDQLDGLQVTQIFRIYKVGLAVIVDVALKNTTSHLMQNVYYMRTVDPDNNAEQSSASNPYSTTNTIMHQGNEKGGAVVVARQSTTSQASNLVSKTIPSLLGLYGQGENSRVAQGGTDDVNFPYYRNPKDVYNGVQSVGETKTEDSPIAIAFKFDNIFPGQTVKFRTGYQLADITPASLDLNDSDTSGNGFKQAYELGTHATNITDSDVSISGLDNDTLVGASITLSNAFPDDKLTIVGNLPSGIHLNADEKNSNTEIYLAGAKSKADYIQALQQITFENKALTSNAQTRNILMRVLDSNYTPSIAATSIIEIVIPVTLNTDSIIQDNIFNAREASTIILTGSAAPNAAIEVVFTDKEGQKVAKTVTSNASGVWTLSTNPADISTLADGVMKIDVTSTDTNGNKSSLTRELQKDTTVHLSITSPKNGETASSTEPVITGKSDPDAKISLTLSGTDYLATTDSAGNWSITLPKQTLGTRITFTLKAIDPASNEAKLDGSNSITIKIPSIPLEVTKVEETTTPTFMGISIASTKITVTVPTSGGGTETCTTTTDADGNWSCQMPVLPTGGPYTAIVNVVDNKGNTSSITQQFTVPELPLIIDSPADNAVISGSEPTVSGTSIPDTSITVTASTGQSCTATTDSSNHWSCQLSSLALDSHYTLTVITTDSIGNSTTKSIDISTDKLPLAVISPGDKGTTGDSTPNFIGTTTSGTSVTVTTETGQKCQTIADEKGYWSCELPKMPVGGPYSVIIKAEDTHSNTTTLTVSITIPKIPLIITSPIKDETIADTRLIVIGTSDPNTPITVLGPDGERCTTLSNEKGDWSCQLDNLQSGDKKYITVISGDKGESQKISLVSINIKNSGEKVMTLLKGGGGSFSFFILFLMSLGLLLKQAIRN